MTRSWMRAVLDLRLALIRAALLALAPKTRRWRESFKRNENKKPALGRRRRQLERFIFAAPGGDNDRPITSGWWRRPW
jgi:hypothetical protein